MTEFDKADLNKNGVIEKNEWNKLALEDRRLEMIDRDLKRNAERRFTGFALAGMLIYPFIILLASASIEFSINSFTTPTGLSITSPAAISFMISGGNKFISCILL